MSEVTPEKIMLQNEEFDSGAAASEGAMKKLASSAMFWNKFYEGSKAWYLNGPYSTLPFPQIGVDGGHPCWYNMKLFAISFYNLLAGASGEIEFDIIRHHVGGGPDTSIFTTRPKIPYTAGDNARMILDAENDVILFSSAGITKPIFASLDLDAGDFLTLNLIQGQVGGKNAGVIIGLKPR